MRTAFEVGENKEHDDKDKDVDCEEFDKHQPEFDIKKWLIIREDGWFNFYWKNVYIVSCFVSSWTYAHVATFGMQVLDDKSPLYYMDMFFDVFFWLSILKSFLTDYVPDGDHNRVRDHTKIAKRYVNYGSFKMELFCVIPYSTIFYWVKEKKLFHLIKIMRVIPGLSFFNVAYLMHIVKRLIKSNMEHKIKNDP